MPGHLSYYGENFSHINLSKHRKLIKYGICLSPEKKKDFIVTPDFKLYRFFASLKIQCHAKITHFYTTQ